MCKLCDKLGAHVTIFQLNFISHDEKDNTVEIYKDLNCDNMQAFIECANSEEGQYYTFNIEQPMGVADTKTMKVVYHTKIKYCPLCGRHLEK